MSRADRRAWESAARKGPVAWKCGHCKLDCTSSVKGGIVTVRHAHPHCPQFKIMPLPSWQKKEGVE